jgi:type I restriction enzyme M protein
MSGFNHASLVNKVWNYAHVLRDHGVPYGDYLEQITYLLFLKMDAERSELLGEPSGIPEQWRWESLKSRDGDALEVHYRHALEALAKEGGLLGAIFRKSQNKIQDPAKLRRIVSMIDEETWIGLDVDVKGAIYEGLLERNAQEVKSGAGQYFTPRPIIKAIVEVIDPQPGDTVHDPASGTGGFLLAAFDHIAAKTKDRRQLAKLRTETFSGSDIVGAVVRLCAMNLYLHGIGGETCPIAERDALASDPGKRFDIVITNPPFGKKSSYSVVGEDGDIDREVDHYERDDFKVTTSNKQLNFLQHIMTILKTTGRAAVVLPDNVLFDGGAGEKLRKRLLDQFDFHTLLRLPTGIFYKQGVKANVLFFDKKPASEDPWTRDLWIYDFRTNLHFTLKQNPLRTAHLEDFLRCYNRANRHQRQETERFRRFSYEDLVKRDKLNLDIFWLKDESLGDGDNLPPPHEIAAEIVENLEAALEQFRSVAAELAPS